MQLQRIIRSALVAACVLAFSTPTDRKMGTPASGRPAETVAYDDVDPVWSPDGFRIAFYSNRTGHFALYTMAADGSHLNAITH